MTAPSPDPSGPRRLTPRDRSLGIGLVIAGLLVQLPALAWGVPGGKAVNNALRILDGDIPYRDFWTMYAPGHFYLVAAVFKVFGTHVWTQSAAAHLLVAIDAALVFAIARRLGVSARLAWLLGAAFVAGQWAPHEVSSYESALVLLLLAVDRAIVYAQGGGARTLLVAGLLCGVGAWFKHDVSFHVAVALTLGLSAAWLIAARDRPAAWVAPIGVAWRIGGGALLTAGPVIAWLAWVAGPDAWRDLIAFPAGDFRIVRGEPYPSLLPDWSLLGSWVRDPLNVERAAGAAQHLARWIQANVPQVVFVVTVVVLVRLRASVRPATLMIAALVLAAMPLFWMSAQVQQNTHLFSLWLCSIVLGSLFWAAGGLRAPAARAVLTRTHRSADGVVVRRTAAVRRGDGVLLADARAAHVPERRWRPRAGRAGGVSAADCVIHPRARSGGRGDLRGPHAARRDRRLEPGLLLHVGTPHCLALQRDSPWRGGSGAGAARNHRGHQPPARALCRALGLRLAEAYMDQILANRQRQIPRHRRDAAR